MSNTDKSKKDKTLKDFLAENLPARIQSLLPKHMKPDRFMAVAFAALARNPELNNCSALSVLDCMIKCSQVGLEPDGRLVYLVPFKQNDENGKYLRTNCTFILGYMGMVQICRRSDKVADIQAEVVFKNDVFDYEFGTNKFLRHIPFADEGDCGPITHVWSMVTFANGHKDFRVWKKSKIDAIRKRSRSGNSGKSPWSTDYEEMAKKSIFRNHFKWLPFDQEVIAAVTSDDDDAIDIDAEVVKPKRLPRQTTESVAEAFGDIGGFADLNQEAEKEAVPVNYQMGGQEEPQEEYNPFDGELPAHKQPNGKLFS